MSLKREARDRRANHVGVLPCEPTHRAAHLELNGIARKKLDGGHRRRVSRRRSKRDPALVEDDCVDEPSDAVEGPDNERRPNPVSKLLLHEAQDNERQLTAQLAISTVLGVPSESKRLKERRNKKVSGSHRSSTRSQMNSLMRKMRARTICEMRKAS